MHINNKIKKNTYLYKIRVFIIFYFSEKVFLINFAFLRCGILLALLLQRLKAQRKIFYLSTFVFFEFLFAIVK